MVTDLSRRSNSACVLRLARLMLSSSVSSSAFIRDLSALSSPSVLRSRFILSNGSEELSAVSSRSAKASPLRLLYVSCSTTRFTSSIVRPPELEAVGVGGAVAGALRAACCDSWRIRLRQ